MVGLASFAGASEVKIVIKGVDDFSKTFKNAQGSLEVLAKSAQIASKLFVVATASIVAFSLKMASELNAADVRVQEFTGSISIMRQEISSFAAETGTSIMENLQPTIDVIFQNAEAFQVLGDAISFVAENFAKGISVVTGWVQSLGNAAGMVSIFLTDLQNGVSVTDAWTHAQEVHKVVLEQDAAAAEKYRAQAVGVAKAQLESSKATSNDTKVIKEHNSALEKELALLQQRIELNRSFAQSISIKLNKNGGIQLNTFAQGAGGGIAFAQQGQTVGVNQQGQVTVNTGGIGGSLSASNSTSTAASQSQNRQGPRFNDVFITKDNVTHRISDDDNILAFKNGMPGGVTVNVHIAGNARVDRDWVDMIEDTIAERFRSMRA